MGEQPRESHVFFLWPVAELIVMADEFLGSVNRK
jgi:hypothetical protein